MALKDKGKKGVGEWAGAGKSGKTSKWHIHPGQDQKKTKARKKG